MVLTDKKILQFAVCDRVHGMRKTASDALDSEKIQANLKTGRIGKKILVYQSISSTNDVAAEYAEDKKNDGLAVFAEKQTQGRGRAGNKWITAKADSILVSILLTKSKLNPELLSLTGAVAVAEAIGKKAKVKWPNDIILGGKKVAGILVETKSVNSRTAYIIGIGINCHQKKKNFSVEFRKSATSIDIETNTVCDRISVAKRLLTSMDYWLKAAEKNNRKIIEQWQKLSIQLGHRVTFVFNGRRFSGNCIGIDPQKGLIVQLDTGGIRMFDASHTTIARE